MTRIQRKAVQAAASSLAALATLWLPQAQAQVNTPRFEVVADGSEVKDLQTGLIWRRCSEGQTWTGSTCAGEPVLYPWADALAQARSAQTPRKLWRLPDVKEMGSLVDHSRRNPAIDVSFFPNTRWGYYSTSTPAAGTQANVWIFVATDGALGNVNRVDAVAVRLVRTTD